MAIICSVCTTIDKTIEFSTLKELSDHSKNGHRTKGVSTLPPTPKKEEVLIEEEMKEKPYLPPTLEYKYLGLCKKGHPVETILIEAGEYDLQVAYCSECKEKIAQEYVMSLTAQRLAIQSLSERKKDNN